MARPGRPASENYQSGLYSVKKPASRFSGAGIGGREDEGDETPIFSLSKSSMDVVMATGPPHKRDPAWTGIDLRRSSSTNTHSEQNLLHQLHPQVWQQVSSLQSSLAALSTETHSPPAINECWMANMQRWSKSSTQSRSSTPDTVVWKGGPSRPCSLTQEALCTATPDPSISKPASPITTASPFMSPLFTPTSAPAEVSTTSPLARSSHRDSQSISPLIQLESTEDEGVLDDHLLAFKFPSPIPSSASIEEGVSSDPGRLDDGIMEQLPSPEGSQLPDNEEERSPEGFDYLISDSASKEIESPVAKVANLELPWQPEQRCQVGRRWRSPIVSSLSDSQLCEGHHKGIKEFYREEGTMTSPLELVDVAVQTVSPVGSWWELRRNTSNLGSHSILGSPPGSRLNLKSSVGSHSNLVSPSSSMFPVSSGEEEEKHADDAPSDMNSSYVNDLERRRSCLKIQVEERDEYGRRSSMKQVQWDEDGMTWDVHGASVDPDELSSAIQKHLELQKSPQPAKRPSKKKKAPKPPLISNMVKAITPELNPPAMVITSSCVAESESQETPEADGGKAKEEDDVKTEDKAEAVRKISRAEGENTKEEEQEVQGKEAGHPKSPSHGSGHSRKRSVIRSLRPIWCGGSRKADEKS